jgi:hypothetical protein
MMATLTVAAAHTFVLTVSHGLLFRNPLICSGTRATASCSLIETNAVLALARQWRKPNGAKATAAVSRIG